jgi:hypothetical protein
MVELLVASKLIEGVVQVITVLLGLTVIVGKALVLVTLDVADAVQLFAASVTVKV